MENENNFYFFIFLFWVISWRLKFMCRRFGTLCSIFIGRVNKNNNLDQIARVFFR
jgi:hypothetical protein